MLKRTLGSEFLGQWHQSGDKSTGDWLQKVIKIMDWLCGLDCFFSGAAGSEVKTVIPKGYCSTEAVVNFWSHYGLGMQYLTASHSALFIEKCCPTWGHNLKKRENVVKRLFESVLFVKPTWFLKMWYSNWRSTCLCSCSTWPHARELDKKSLVAPSPLLSFPRLYKTWTSPGLDLSLAVVACPLHK